MAPLITPYRDGGTSQLDLGGHGPVIAVALFLPFIGGIALDALLLPVVGHGVLER